MDAKTLCRRMKKAGLSPDKLATINKVHERTVRRWQKSGVRVDGKYWLP